MSPLSRLSAIALLAAALGGCNGGLGNLLGNTGGVMPESEVGLPPSMRGSVKNAPQRTTTSVDDNGNPVQAAPSRQLALPNSAKGETRTADGGPRRIRRDEIEGNDANGRSTGGSMGPSMTPNGGIGMGGKF